VSKDSPRDRAPRTASWFAAPSQIGLARNFSLFSLLFILIAGLGLAVLMQRLSLEQLHRMAEERNVDMAYVFRNTLWPQFADVVRDSNGKSSSEMRSAIDFNALLSATAKLMKDSDVVKIKVYNLRGLTVFSTDALQIGEDKSDNPGFRSALGGTVVSALTHRGEFDAFEGKRTKIDMIFSYVPIRDGSQVVGVFEVYQDVTPTLRLVKRSFWQIVAMLVAVLALLYLMQYWVVRRMDRHLQARSREIIEQNTALSLAKENAERANLAKSDFLSRMSHELRTPLNAILGFGQLLELDARQPEQADNAHEIVKAGRHLLDLINEVLDLARIESGKFTVSQEVVPLRPLIEDCLTLIRPLAEARGLRIDAAGHECVGQVRADHTRLKQVLLNLLSNAVKYNRAGGSLGITCVAAGDTVQIRISDSGEGLTPEQQGRLFVAFERLDADQHAIEGTGIGLALSKRLVKLMDGEIGVESTPGVGSTFWVRMATAKGHADAVPEAGAARSDVQAPAAGQKQWDVLCIEDNPANMRLIERILARRSDIRLLTADAPGLGLELALAHRPALILLDINLPDMDGYAVMQCLRESAVTRDIPVVAISANAMPQDLARGKAAGFVEYLTKPLEVDRLVQVIDGIIKAVQP